MTAASLIRVANLDELRGDGPHALSADGFDVVVVRTPVGLRAFEGRCPHQGALLGEGELDGDTLVCRNHRWRFSVDSGQREGGPQCLASCPVVERERAIFVDVSGLSRGPARIVAKRTLDDLPGPRGLPFLGNIHQLDLTKLHLILERWAAQYGPVYLFRMGSARAVVLSDPKWCDQVLRARPEIFTRRFRHCSRSLPKWALTEFFLPRATPGVRSGDSPCLRWPSVTCAACIRSFRPSPPT